MLFNVSIVTEVGEPAESSDDFKLLQIVVSEINDEYVKKWCKKAKNEKKILYSKNEVEKIFEILPNLASKDGFKLVRNVLFSIIINFYVVLLLHLFSDKRGI